MNDDDRQDGGPPTDGEGPDAAPLQDDSVADGPDGRRGFRPTWTWNWIKGRAAADRLCPICLGDSNCQFAMEGAVLCRRVVCADRKGLPRSVISKADWCTGVEFQPGSLSKKVGNEGRMWLRIGPDGKRIAAPVLSPEETANREAEELAKKERSRQRAETVLRRAMLQDQGVLPGGGHHMVVGYLASRGIEVRDLPGGRVPACIRWLDDCPDVYDRPNRRWITHGAMVARVTSADATEPHIRGMHATYLIDTEKNDERGVPIIARRPTRPRFPSKRWHASCDGVAKLGLPNVYPLGVLLLGEGLETVLSMMAAVGQDVAGWAMLSTANFGRIRLPRQLYERGPDGVPLVHTVIIGGDLDKELTRDGRVSKAGQTKTPKAAQLIREQCPWVSVHVRFPTHDVAPELVNRIDQGDGRTEDVPIAADAGVDWNDVLRLSDGKARVRRGLLDGIDLEGNARRARAMADMSEQVAAASFAPATAKPSSDNPPSPPSSGSGDSGGGGGGGESGGEGAGGESSDDPSVLPDSELGRARRYLDERWSPGLGQDRASTVYDLVYIGKTYRFWNGQVWVLISGEGPNAIRQDVRRWLTPKKERRRGGVTDYVDASAKEVECLCKAIADEVRVDPPKGQNVFWLAPRFDARGRLLSYLATWKAAEHKPEEKGLTPPKDLIAFPSGSLDAGVFEREGLLIVHPHDRRLYCEQVMEFDVPWGEAERALDSEGGIEGLSRKLAPAWWRFIEGVFSQTGTAEQAREQVLLMAMLFWYWRRPTNRYKNANFTLIVGPGNSGKGTILLAAMKVLGPGHSISTSMPEMKDKNHMTAWKGKHLAYVDEFVITDPKDAKEWAAITKKITSEGAKISTRELYEREDPDTEITARVLALADQYPPIKDPTILNRMLVFELMKGHEATDGGAMKQAIEAEGPGLFAFAMLGAEELRRRTRIELAKPPGSRLAVMRQPSAGLTLRSILEAGQGNVRPFIADCLDLAKTDKSISTRELVLVWMAYLTDLGQDDPGKPNDSTFSGWVQTALRSAGWRGEIRTGTFKNPETGGEARGAIYHGVGLTTLGESLLRRKRTCPPTPGASQGELKYGADGGREIPV